MIKLITEADEDIVVYDADEVMSIADNIMSLYTQEHERHRKEVGNIFNRYKEDYETLVQYLTTENTKYKQNLDKIKAQETEELTDIYDIQIS